MSNLIRHFGGRQQKKLRLSKKILQSLMAIRKSAAVSMRPELKELAEARAEALGLNFSAYVNQLIRADLAARKELVVREESAVYKSPTKKRAKKEASKD